MPKFKIAFSFSGKYREKYVEPICKQLLLKGFKRNDIFYDAWHEEKINGAHGDTALRNIYGEEASLIVVLLSPDYVAKNWTGRIEWPTIKEKINTGKDENICFLAVDEPNIDCVDGIFKTQLIYKTIDDLEPEDIASFIRNKYEYVCGYEIDCNDQDTYSGIDPWGAPISIKIINCSSNKVELIWRNEIDDVIVAEKYMALEIDDSGIGEFSIHLKIPFSDEEDYKKYFQYTYHGKITIANDKISLIFESGQCMSYVLGGAGADGYEYSGGHRMGFNMQAVLYRKKV